MSYNVNSGCAAGFECSSNTCVASFKTMVGNAVSWIWNTTSASIRSGTPLDWAWRAFQPGSGRQIPNGSAAYWTWKGE